MKYDYIVLGAGSAGSIVATRLSEDSNRSVLLLEAGPDHSAFEKLPAVVKFRHPAPTDLLVRHPHRPISGQAPQTAPPMLVPRGKVTGGSSAINGQVFLYLYHPFDN